MRSSAQKRRGKGVQPTHRLRRCLGVFHSADQLPGQPLSGVLEGGGCEVLENVVLEHWCSVPGLHCVTEREMWCAGRKCGNASLPLRNLARGVQGALSPRTTARPTEPHRPWNASVPRVAFMAPRPVTCCAAASPCSAATRAATTALLVTRATREPN